MQNALRAAIGLAAMGLLHGAFAQDARPAPLPPDLPTQQVHFDRVGTAPAIAPLPPSRPMDARPIAGARPVRQAAPLAVRDCSGDTSIYTASSSDLIAILDSYAADCMNSNQALFAVNADTFRLYSNDNVRAVAAVLLARGPGYRVLAQNNVHQLLVYLRTANYVSFYSQGALSYDAATANAVNAALLALASSPDFTDASSDNGKVMADFFLDADSDLSRAAVAPALFRYLRALIADSAYRNTGQDGAILAMQFLLFRAAVNGDTAFAAYVNAQDSSLAELMYAALVYYSKPAPGETTIDARMAANMAGEFVRFLSYASQRAAIEARIGDALALFTRLSQPWLRISAALDTYQADCSRWSVCKADVAPELKQSLFTHQWSFDDGALVMHTPLDLPKARQLYLAMKLVEAQFKRKTGITHALDDDVNSTLNMLVYGSRADYETYQPYLYGLDTNNGGIYIENGATFYTYERTAADSIYSLEELLRHEYVHYLTGRYTIHGSFGDAHYSNDRLTWFDEGFAEFLAGSTQADGVQVRADMVQQIQSDGSQQMHLPELLKATYASGFKFYRYGALFFNLLDQRHLATLRELHGSLRADDTAGFDTLVASLSADAVLGQEYRDFLASKVAQVATLAPFQDGPSYDPQDLMLDASEALRDPLAAAGLPGTSCTQNHGALDIRIACSGTLDGDAGAALDAVIKRLLAGGINNWTTLSCWHEGGSSRVPYQCEFGARAAGTVRRILPKAPAMVGAVAGDMQASVSFTPAADADASTSYLVQANTGTAQATGLSSPITVTGLTNGASYQFTVSAVRGGLNSVPSALSNRVVPQPTPLPLGAAPSTASGIGAYYEVVSTGIVLHWKNPSGGATYSLTLDNGLQRLYYGGHQLEQADVNYQHFGLQGSETLTGYFQEYGADRNWVRNFPTFSIALASIVPTAPNGLPLIEKKPNAASGIGAYYEVDRGRLVVRWTPPANGNRYTLFVSSRQQSLYYRSYPRGRADIDFTGFKLDPGEVLTAHFSEYGANGDWVRDYPAFALPSADVQ